jgi:stage V sporulation protein S
MILKVSSKSNPNSVAGAIAGSVKEENVKNVELYAIGAGAVNQAVKSIAIARGFLVSSGIDLICIPSFKQVKLGDTERTCMRILVEVN